MSGVKVESVAQVGHTVVFFQGAGCQHFGKASLVHGLPEAELSQSGVVEVAHRPIGWQDSLFLTWEHILEYF